ncbi:hypothetical protein BH20ACT22_BH20ACT22_19950 [soil metagenome]
MGSVRRISVPGSPPGIAAQQLDGYISVVAGMTAFAGHYNQVTS